MSDLIVVGFEDENTADQVLNRLAALQKEYLVDLEDSVVVVRDQGGKVRLKQAIDLVGTGAASGGLWGSLWGTLIGLLFLNPAAGLLTGAVLGAGAGALSGKLADYGIDDEFVRSLGQTIQPGTSALFVLVRKARAEKVLPELQQFNGKVLRTSLSNDQEQRLKEALEGVQKDARA